MRTKQRAFSMAFMQVVRTPGFYAAMIGVCALGIISIWDYYLQSGTSASVAYYLDLFTGLTMFKKLVVLFAAIPYAASFCSDWNCQYIKPVVIRTGIKKYAWSKIAACFVSALLTVFGGMLLFIAILSVRMPLFPVEHMNEYINAPYAPLALGPVPILYLLANAFVFSLAAALWAVVGLTFSSYIPNRFVAIATPVIACYLLEELTSFLPRWLNIYYLTRSADVLKQGPLISFSYFCLVFILFTVLVGMLFHTQVKRRVRNEVV